MHESDNGHKGMPPSPTRDNNPERAKNRIGRWSTAEDADEVLTHSFASSCRGKGRIGMHIDQVVARGIGILKTMLRKSRGFWTRASPASGLPRRRLAAAGMPRSGGAGPSGRRRHAPAASRAVSHLQHRSQHQLHERLHRRLRFLRLLSQAQGRRGLSCWNGPSCSKRSKRPSPSAAIRS